MRKVSADLFDDEAICYSLQRLLFVDKSTLKSNMVT